MRGPDTVDKSKTSTADRRRTRSLQDVRDFAVEETPILVERVVADIDEVVRAVRFDGWQETAQGDREVQQALRRTLYVRYKMRDQDLYERAHEYTREYY